MKTQNTFSCYLIGADTLLIECGEILLAKDHEISGVITSVPRISQWAKSKSIPVIPYNKDYGEHLVDKDFDYLFSITHLAIIRDEILALPKKGAINFHDGPLPAYAGLNAPAWALMNNEKSYGITWHRITARVDEGNILKQSMFELAKDETSLSINTKCFAAALESFPGLVDELANETTQAIKQDLSQRSYFGKFDRPKANALLDWQQPTQTLASLVHALNFGDYPNPLASAKFRIKAKQSVCVSNATAIKLLENKAPGTIISVDEEKVCIATSDGALSLSGIKDLNGHPVSPQDLQLNVDDKLDLPSKEEMDAITKIGKTLARNDEHWNKCLSNLEPIELPYQQKSLLVSNAEYMSMQLDIQEKSYASIVNAFGILLARLNRKQEFDVAFTNTSISKDSQIANDLINDYSILHFNVDTKESSAQALNKVSYEIAQVIERGAWARDTIGRNPHLNAKPELINHSALPIAISIGGSQALTGSALTLCISEDCSRVELFYDKNKLSEKSSEKLSQQLTSLVQHIQNTSDKQVGELELLTQDEKQRILENWNDTVINYDDSDCIHHLFEKRVAQHPNATALVFEEQSISYLELNNAANNLAKLLIEKGIGRDDLVGVHVQRSIDLMIATLGIHKAGAAYVPLDPAFPEERIAYMVDDAQMPLVITQVAIKSELPESNAEIICIDDISHTAAENPNLAMDSADLAYVIYTSGSTGNPKGVMVEHRNATNFFVGMDQRIEHENPGVWLAVTSLSFDISVLELFWTLTRGFKVVIYREDRNGDDNGVSKAVQNRPMEFGMFLWGNDDAAGSAKYRLLTEGAKYFDENGFDSVWTPERHFGAFGGPYPNPAITSAAVASITKNLNIRTGSLVTPLHHPVRIAEDWAVIDNLSDGRVGLSIAAGWQPNDFIIMPQNHENNKQVMLDQIEEVKRLWRGESVTYENPLGQKIEVKTLPRPVQKELPIWFTTAGNPESYRLAGRLGMNILTHLLGQSLEEVAGKIKIYREAREEAGFDPATGKVSLMLHTFVGECDDEVRELVRQPMKEYLGAAVSLVLDFAWTFPAFKRPGGPNSKPEDIDIKSLSAEEVDTILEFAFERYFETSGLFGSPETCLKMINRCKAADVDEIGCLLDFGVETDKVMDSLPQLKKVRDMSNEFSDAKSTNSEVLDMSLPAQMQRHAVTHFQCTPSMARMLSFDPEAKKQLANLKHMMVGGEAFPTTLAQDLKAVLKGRLTNMYGPTETTIWSTTQEVDNPNNIPIGRPIANTDIYILDENHQPVPIGVPGDLFIGGQGVVRGYLKRQELTQERFILNPFKNDGSRIYRTGDLAQYREDGVIEFLGRVDHQVKIRGYRIELGEIESRLALQDYVGECVLLLREDQPGDQRLVAYVVAKDLAPSCPIAFASELRDHLRESLPEYMIPNDFVKLEAMPLTPNGKLDRKQLPVPGINSNTQAEYQAPEDELQQTIVNIWQETLQLDKVGVNDNFFDLGGHSLLIVKVHQLIKAQVEKPISLTDLYRFPTIKSLTDFINSDGNNESLKKSSDRASRRRERMGLRKRGRK